MIAQHRPLEKGTYMSEIRNVLYQNKNNSLIFSNSQVYKIINTEISLDVDSRSLGARMGNSKIESSLNPRSAS